jgi:pimeloyl-ACP methyl ester carboxylesterase
VALLEALGIPRAVLAGYDWGARVCVVAAHWPERCTGLVSVNSYLIQDIGAAMTPIRPDLEAGGSGTSYYFLTERGRVGLAADPRGIAEGDLAPLLAAWSFDDATLGS